ncbi:MAG TPA: DUF5691 domain-containing protein [Trebonia sp.]|nr:DUF5691 domain-containing protein [Trebonia sp.]
MSSDGITTPEPLLTPYEELVTAATVGLSRRPLPQGDRGQSSAPGDQADALLEAAALHVAARRAGVLPPPGVVAPAPMAPDRSPELPPRGTQILRQAMKDTGLLADLLAVTAEAGYRAPAPLLPTLLDAAARTVALRPAVRATLGARGRWLAAHRAEWRRVADLTPAAGRTGTDTADDPRGWETGSRAERIAYLAALREHDPLAGRELLAAGWSRESAEERAQLLPVLSAGLSPADEEFLEAALDDRATAVRAAARSLLARLPQSGFRLRAAARATALLRPASDGRRRWLEAALPDGRLGPELTRDGIVDSPPGASVGARAWQLTQLIAAAPLEAWTALFELGASEIASLEIRLAPDQDGEAVARPDDRPAKGKRATGGLPVEVHAGWRLAALRQGDAQWAMALLAGDGPLLAPAWPEAAWAGNHELAALLSPADRASLAAGLFTRLTRAARDLEGTKWGSRASATTIAELTAWPGPWPDALADYVLARVTVSLSAQGAARTLQPLVFAAARSIAVTGPRDYGAEFIRLAHRPDCAYPWLAVLRRAADTLALRRDFHGAIGR